VSAEHAACFPGTGSIVITSLQVWAGMTMQIHKGSIFGRN
jgi:hypothetical protein